MRRGGATVVKRARIRSARPDSLPRSTMISADYEEMGEAGERLGEVCYWKLGFRSRPHAGPRPQRASLRTPTRCGSASCGHSSGPLVISGGELLAYPCSPKRDNTAFHTQKAPPLTLIVVPAALGPQDNLQIIMMVAMWMAEQPVDKASKHFLPLSVWTVLCGGTDPSVRRTRKGRRGGGERCSITLKREYKLVNPKE